MKNTTLSLVVGILLVLVLSVTALAYQYDAWRNLSVKRHTQQRWDWCGPAVAQMYLEYDGCYMQYPDDYDMQEFLYYDYIQPNNCESKWGSVDWATDPCGMKGCLEDYYGDYGGGVKYYYLHQTDNAILATKGIASYIQNGGEPSAALVYAGWHWMLPKGGEYRVETTPSGYEGIVKVYGLYVHDPAPGGWNNQYVTADTWVSDYFTPIQTIGSAWDGDVVYVADPPRENQYLVFYDNPERGPISKGEVMTVLEDGLRRHGFYSDNHFDKSILRATFGEPIFVKTEGDFPDYYIVPLINERNVIGLGMVDAEEGEFMGLAYDGDLPEYPIVSKDEALDIIKRKIMNDENTELIENIEKSLELFWTPCPESWSPYLPLWSAEVKGNQVYVNQGGEVFDNLTRGICGG